MDATARADAIAEIRRVLGAYRAARPTDQATLTVLTDGKLYELFVLADVVKELVGRGYSLRFVGSTPTPKKTAAGHSTLKFKAGPGMIKLSDSHFEVIAPAVPAPAFRIFVDIEFNTLGQQHTSATDDSRRHEIDIIVTTAVNGYPDHDQIVLGVECKAVANFGKALVKEALGVRRELSYFHDFPLPSALNMPGTWPPIEVEAEPPSEYRLVYLDAKGNNYSGSPGAFGIEFRHLEP